MGASRRRRAAGACLLLLGALVAMLVVKRPAREPQPRVTPPARAGHSPPAAGRRRASQGGGAIVPGPVQTALAAVPRALADYLRSAQYPPSSRPLTRDMIDLLEPNRRYERERPVPGAEPLRYLLTADRYFVVGHEAATILLEVLGEGRWVAADRLEARVVRLDHPRLTAPVGLERDGGLYVGRLEPAATALGERSGQLELVVDFEVAGQRVTDTLRFRYTAPPEIPARFSGVFDDRVEDGSLVVRAELVVGQPGFYVVDCNLYDARGEPAAWTRWKGHLEPGDRIVELRFFGKVLRDARAPAPWTLGELRGVLAGRDGAHALPAFAGTYRTRRVRLEELSDAPWQGPAKRARLAFFEAQAGGPHELLRR